MLNCNNYRITIGNVVCEYSEEQNLDEKLDLLNSEYSEIIDSIELTKELIQMSVSEIEYNSMFLKKNKYYKSVMDCFAVELSKQDEIVHLLKEELIKKSKCVNSEICVKNIDSNNILKLINNLLFSNSKMNEYDYINVVGKIIESNHRVLQADIDDYSHFLNQVWSHVCPVLKKQEEELKKFIGFYSKNNEPNVAKNEFNSEIMKLESVNEEFSEVVKQRVCYFKSNMDTLRDSISIHLEDYRQLNENLKELDIRLCEVKENIQKTKDKIISRDEALLREKYSKFQCNVRILE